MYGLGLSGDSCLMPSGSVCVQKGGGGEGGILIIACSDTTRE